MKALVICSSDVLGMPAIIQLQQQGRLHGVALPEKAAAILIPALKQFGIADADIHVLTKAGFAYQLKALIQDYQAEVLFTLTFGWLIPTEILEMLPNRCINFHFGLLPKYAGADPIFWQLANGETHAGLSIHIMTDKTDAGPIVLLKQIPIIPGETYGLHCQRSGQLGAESAIQLLNMLEAGTAEPTEQQIMPALYYKKPDAAQLTINWKTQTAAQIENLINATNYRYSGAATTLRQTEVRILEVSPVDVNNPSPVAPGTIVHADYTYGLIVACVNGQYLKVNVVQIREGYLSGIKFFSLGFQLGEIFGS